MGPVTVLAGGSDISERLDRFLGTSPGDDRRYIVYLLAIAVVGWALASYDFNLLVVALPTIKKSLGLSSTQVGLLAFLVYAAMLVISLVVGYSMDTFGRKVMWQFSLIGAAIFTGLTFFVHSFVWLVVVRALASGLANSELAISITLVNEQVPARRRGFLAWEDRHGQLEPGEVVLFRGGSSLLLEWPVAREVGVGVSGPAVEEWRPDRGSRCRDATDLRRGDWVSRRSQPPGG